MVRKTSEGFERSKPRYRTTDDVLNESLRKSHCQNLELARESLEEIPIGLRDFTWLTLPIDTSQLPLAKAMIRKFQDEFLDAMGREAGAPHSLNEVDRMAVQFFPLTKLEAMGTKP